MLALDLPPNADLVAAIASIPRGPDFARTVQAFSKTPERSYVRPEARALLYLLLRMTRPALAVEIGTLFAGMTEIFARAFAENGSGLIRTIDPFGAERVPPILDQWPPELKQHVAFSPINSMQLYQELIGSGTRPDLIFIDGNHDYEFVLFDLLTAARCVKRGGIVILDDCDEPGVARAAREFERSNLRWRAVDALGGHWRILVAPIEIGIGTEPVAFPSGGLEQRGIDGFSIELADPVCAGQLRYTAYLRSFPWDFQLGKGKPSTVTREGTIDIRSGQRQVSLSLPAFVSAEPLDGFSRSYELVLRFQPVERDGELLLKKEPVAITGARP